MVEKSEMIVADRRDHQKVAKSVSAKVASKDEPRAAAMVA